jgi:hypothetical protein
MYCAPAYVAAPVAIAQTVAVPHVENVVSYARSLEPVTRAVNTVIPVTRAVTTLLLYEFFNSLMTFMYYIKVVP